MVKNNKELLNWFSVLVDVAFSTLVKISKKLNITHNIILHTIFSINIVMNKYAKGIKSLMEKGDVLSADILLRTLIEGFINIFYILADNSSIRAISYILEDYKTREKNVKTIKELIKNGEIVGNFFPLLSTPEKCDEYIKKLEDEKNKNLLNLKENLQINLNDKELIFPRKVYDRAEKAHLQSIYKIPYPYLSNLTHINSSGLKDFIKIVDNKYIIDIKNSETEKMVLLDTAYRIYLKTTEELYNQFNINENNIKRFKDLLPPV